MALPVKVELVIVTPLDLATVMSAIDSARTIPVLFSSMLSIVTFFTPVMLIRPMTVGSLALAEVIFTAPAPAFVPSRPIV